MLSQADRMLAEASRALDAVWSEVEAAAKAEEKQEEEGDPVLRKRIRAWSREIGVRKPVDVGSSRSRHSKTSSP